MKDELTEFETAKLAEEKGFDEYCDMSWRTISSKMDANKRNSLGDTHTPGSGAEPIGVTIFISIYAPTQSLLQRWLREVHEIDIEIELTDNSRHSYYESSIKKQDIRDYNDEDYFDQVRQVHIKGKFKTYEQALEKGLQEALKLMG